MFFCRLKLKLDDADLIAKALKPDDMEWCYCYTKDSYLIIEVKTDKIGAMLSAVDDYFINIKAVLPILKYLRSNKSC